MMSDDLDPIGEANEMPPFFSIITVSLNNSIGLRRTWLSLSSQSDSDWEWIVVDGGSVDDTPDFLKKNKSSIAWGVSESDGGIYDAMNKGCAQSKGNYLLFLNAGDLLEEATVLEKLKRKIAEKSDKEKKPDLIFGATMQEFQSGIRIFRPPKNCDFIWHGLPAFHQSILFRREALSRTPYDLSYRILGDYAIVARMIVQGRSVIRVNLPVSIFSTDGTSYRNRFVLLRESWRIQKEIIESPFWRRALSYFRGLIALIIARVLMSRIVGILASHK